MDAFLCFAGGIHFVIWLKAFVIWARLFLRVLTAASVYSGAFLFCGVKSCLWDLGGGMDKVRNKERCQGC